MFDEILSSRCVAPEVFAELLLAIVDNEKGLHARIGIILWFTRQASAVPAQQLRQLEQKVNIIVKRETNLRLKEACQAFLQALGAKTATNYGKFFNTLAMDKENVSQNMPQSQQRPQTTSIPTSRSVDLLSCDESVSVVAAPAVSSRRQQPTENHLLHHHRLESSVTGVSTIFNASQIATDESYCLPSHSVSLQVAAPHNRRYED